MAQVSRLWYWCWWNACYILQFFQHPSRGFQGSFQSGRWGWLQCLCLMLLWQCNGLGQQLLLQFSFCVCFLGILMSESSTTSLLMPPSFVLKWKHTPGTSRYRWRLSRLVTYAGPCHSWARKRSNCFLKDLDFRASLIYLLGSLLLWPRDAICPLCIPPSVPFIILQWWFRIIII